MSGKSQRYMIVSTSFQWTVRKRAITLVEILIALALLAFAYVVLVTTFLGAGRQVPFTAEHYTAMFLVQKVFEDVNHRLMENPHFFSELIRDAEGNFEDVVDGRSKYFRLLENTRDFNFLRPGEDAPIATGSLYEHLKPFKVKVATRLISDPVSGEPRENLISVHVIVQWQAKHGNLKEYGLVQHITGVNDDSLKIPPDTELSAAQRVELERGALGAWVSFLRDLSPQWSVLSTETINLATLVSASQNGNPDSILAVGKMLYLLQRANDQDDQLVTEIRELESRRDRLSQNIEKVTKNAVDRDACLDFIFLQKCLAAKYEKKSLNLINHLQMLRADLPLLGQTFANPNSVGEAFAAYFPAVIAKLRQANVLSDLSILGFSAAEKCYLSLVAKPYISVLPRRQEPGLLRRILDIQKLCILKTHSESEARKNLESFHENIRRFTAKFLGQNPSFLDYLKEEARLAETLRTLRENFAGIADVFAYLKGLSTQVDVIINRVPGKFRR